MTSNDLWTLGLTLLAVLWMTFLLGFVLWLGWWSGNRVFPPVARHRRQPARDGWDYPREDDCETPLPLPAGVFGFAPTQPRGVPSWQLPTQEVPRWR